MRNIHCDKPVTAYQSRIRIVAAKNTVRNPRTPHCSFYQLPVLYLLSSGNYCCSLFHRTVHNPCILGSRMHRIYTFTVNTRIYEHLIARARHLCRLGNHLKRIFLCSVSASCSFLIHINLHFLLLLLFIFTEHIFISLLPHRPSYPLPAYPGK